MGGIPGLDLSDPKQLADFARYDLSGSRFDDGDLLGGADDDLHAGGDDNHDPAPVIIGQNFVKLFLMVIFVTGN